MYDGRVTAPPPDDVQTEDFVITCNTLPLTGPPGVSMSVNIMQGQEVSTTIRTANSSTGNAAALNDWMLHQFWTGGPEDYKTSDGPAYVDFGNFKFGAVCGAVVISLSYSKRGWSRANR